MPAISSNPTKSVILQDQAVVRRMERTTVKVPSRVEVILGSGALAGERTIHYKGFISLQELQCAVIAFRV